MTTPDAPHLRFGAASQFSGCGHQTWLIDPRQPYFALLFVDPVTKVVIVFIAAHAALDFVSRREQFALLRSQNK